MKLYVHSDHIPELESISNRFISQLSREIRSEYITFWTHKLRNSAKLSFYSKFRNEYEMEEYLSRVKNPKQRRNLTKFRISNHKLLVQYGRYQNIPHEQRLCTLCYSNEVEDEYHFTLTCERFSALRSSLLASLMPYSSLNTQLQHTILATRDPNIIHLMATFIHSCFAERDNCLETNE